MSKIVRQTKREWFICVCVENVYLEELFRFVVAREWMMSQMFIYIRIFMEMSLL